MVGRVAFCVFAGVVQEWLEGLHFVFLLVWCRSGWKGCILCFCWCSAGVVRRVAFCVFAGVVQEWLEGLHFVFLLVKCRSG